MRRRQLLGSGIAAVTACTAGCTGDDDGTDPPTGSPTDGTDSPTPSSSPTTTGGPTGTQAENLGTIEYTVTNEDDEVHDLAVAMENNEGRVVEELFEPGFQPGTSVGAGSAGHEPGTSPLTLTFDIESASASYVWDIEACARVDLRVTITTEAEITVEETLCQN